MSSNWQDVILDDIVVFLNSKRVPLSSLEREKIQGIYPYYGASGIVDYINDYVFDGKYLLISEDGENLKTRNTPIAFFADGKYWVNNHAHILDEKEEGILEYLKYYFSTLNIMPYLTGAVQPKLNKKTLSSIPIKLPEKNLRLKINHILSTLDDKIELNRKMNQTLEEMASAIFKSWFVNFDPVHAKANFESETELETIAKELGISKAILDLFPSEFIESELGMIPKGWKIINFKDLVEKYIDNRGKTPPLVENGIPLLEVRTLPNEMLSSEYLTDKCVSDEIYNTWFRSHLETDDILISTVGTIGLTSIVPPNSKFVIAQNVLGIRANEEFILKKFMFYLMKSKFFIDAINARLVTTVQSSIKRKDMETINIIIPDFSTQKEFVKIVTPIMEKMQSNEILNLEKTRDTLLPKLLSGEIDVTDLSLEME